jgi:hypothetical protein
MAKDDEVTIEYRPLADLMRHPRNPKGHDLPKLKDSFRRWGFIIPLVEDAATQQLVAGHGRLEALLQMQAAGEPAPKRIKVGKDGGWSAPVVSGVAFASEREAEAYLLADNRLVEVGGWDAEALAAVLRDVEDPAGTGYEQRDIDYLLQAGMDLPAELPPEIDVGPALATASAQPARAREITCPSCGHAFSS